MIYFGKVKTIKIGKSEKEMFWKNLPNGRDES